MPDTDAVGSRAGRPLENFARRNRRGPCIGITQNSIIQRTKKDWILAEKSDQKLGGVLYMQAGTRGGTEPQNTIQTYVKELAFQAAHLSLTKCWIVVRPHFELS